MSTSALLDVEATPEGPLSSSAERGEFRPRIGIVDAELAASGITRYVLDLINGLDKARFDLTLFCRPDGPYRDLLFPNVRIVHMGTGADAVRREGGAHSGNGSGRVWAACRAAWRGGMPKTVKHLAGFLRDTGRLTATFAHNPVDLLHVQIVGDSKSVVAARRAGIPRVVGTHHLDPSRRKLYDLAPEALTTRCIDHVIAVSESTARAWSGRFGMSRKPMTVIRNGVSIESYNRRQSRESARAALGVPPQGRVIATVGRLAQQKGQLHLLNAVARLAPEYPDLRVVLAGDGPLRAELEDHARSLLLAGRVHFLGHCRGVQPVLDAADIFALPSLWEALPFALLEAMASGLPVVATQVAGVPELVSDGETGILVSPADDAALAEGLRRVLQMSDPRERLGRAARARVRTEYGLQDMLEKTESVYHGLLQTRDEEPLALSV